MLLLGIKMKESIERAPGKDASQQEYGSYSTPPAIQCNTSKDYHETQHYPNITVEISNIAFHGTAPIKGLPIPIDTVVVRSDVFDDY
jgi:hypothetical protein